MSKTILLNHSNWHFTKENTGIPDAVMGYTTTMPQPTDAYTSGIFWMTLAIKYGLPMLGWLITLLAMVGCPLTKEEMVNVQKRIADKKDALRHEVIAEHMQ